jgi:superfamily II RNA helicase
VGINVPIRTVLLTALSKYDGVRMRQLTAREFHQIAGRAGRAGYDTAGLVVVQAPDHEVENHLATTKAGDDPKKKKKIVRKAAPAGFVTWSETSFERLVGGAPEPLQSSMQVSAAGAPGARHREDPRARRCGRDRPDPRQQLRTHRLSCRRQHRFGRS